MNLMLPRAVVCSFTCLTNFQSFRLMAYQAESLYVTLLRVHKLRNKSWRVGLPSLIVLSSVGMAPNWWWVSIADKFMKQLLHGRACVCVCVCLCGVCGTRVECVCLHLCWRVVRFQSQHNTSTWAVAKIRAVVAASTTTYSSSLGGFKHLSFLRSRTAFIAACEAVSYVRQNLQGHLRRKRKRDTGCAKIFRGSVTWTETDIHKKRETSWAKECVIRTEKKCVCVCVCVCGECSDNWWNLVTASLKLWTRIPSTTVRVCLSSNSSLFNDSSLTATWKSI